LPKKLQVFPNNVFLSLDINKAINHGKNNWLKKGSTLTFNLLFLNSDSQPHQKLISSIQKVYTPVSFFHPKKYSACSRVNAEKK